MPNVDLEYDMNGNRTAYTDCPICDGGMLEIAITDDGKPGRIVTSGCRPTCEQDIANGKADAEILEAVAIAVKMHDDTDWSEQWNRRSADGGGEAEVSHRMQQARRMK